MRKLIKLKETDLTHIVKRILLEADKVKCCCQWSMETCEDDGQCYWLCTKWSATCCESRGWGGKAAVKKKKKKS
jgi:hypothetical protein